MLSRLTIKRSERPRCVPPTAPGRRDRVGHIAERPDGAALWRTRSRDVPRERGTSGVTSGEGKRIAVLVRIGNSADHLSSVPRAEPFVNGASK